MEQQIRFCTSADGTHIAYATYGEPRGMPLVIVHGWLNNQELYWKLPEARALYERLADARRWLVAYDRRGIAASQREVTDISFEAQVADLAAVVTNLGLERFDLLGFDDGSAIGIAYAAQHQDRVSRLVLWSPYARAKDTAQGEGEQRIVPVIRANWWAARRALATIVHPSGPVEMQRWWSNMVSDSVTPEMAERYFIALNTDVDLRPCLPRVQAPTLVLHVSGDRTIPVSASREVAALIPDARFVALEGDTAVLYLDAVRIAGIVHQFLDESRAQAGGAEAGGGPGSLVTIIFTDITSSTALRQRLGDARAQELVRAHNAIVREALGAHGGSEIKHTGDGIMASFPSASGAIECAVAIQRSVAEHKDAGRGGSRTAPTAHPLHVHIGLNAGEPVVEERDLFGTAVDLARRVCDAAEAGEILVSNVVRELAAGKGFLFADRGEVALRGFEEPVRLYEVRWRSP